MSDGEYLRGGNRFRVLLGLSSALLLGVPVSLGLFIGFVLWPVFTYWLGVCVGGLDN